MLRAGTISEGGTVRAALRLLLTALPRGPVAILLLLMVLVSATEGIGVFLLVPIIGTIDGRGLPSAIVRVAALTGIPLQLGPLLTAFVVLVLLRGSLQYYRTIHSRKLCVGLMDGQRLKCFRLLLHAEWRTLSKMRQSDNASLIIANIDRLGTAFHYIVAALVAAVTLGGMGLTAFLLSPRMALLALAGGLVVVLAYRGLRRRAVDLGRQLSTANEEVFSRLEESLGALRLIKSIAAEDRAAESLQRTVRELRHTEIAYIRSSARGQVVLQSVGAGVLAVASWIAIGKLGVPAAVLLPLIALFARAMPLLAALQESWQNWLQCTPAIVDIAKMIAVLEDAAEPPPAPRTKPPALFSAIKLDNVFLRHQGRGQPVLDGITLTLPVYTTTAVIGPSGAGKSTLADVLGGLVVPDGGEIQVDDVTLAGPIRRSWRDAVAYVHQEPVLFHDTIRENLRWARPDADEAAMRKVLIDASAQFVFTLPAGLDTVVGDRGGQLSGGERQRLSLARALLRDPALLILDESTSALDPESEATVARALEKLHGRLTMLVIAHRGALAEIADRTVTLAAGRVVSVVEKQAVATDR